MQVDTLDQEPDNEERTLPIFHASANILALSFQNVLYFVWNIVLLGMATPEITIKTRDLTHYYCAQ